MVPPGGNLQEEVMVVPPGGNVQEEVRVVTTGQNLQEETRVPGASSECARCQCERPKGGSAHLEVPNPLNKRQNNLE